MHTCQKRVEKILSHLNSSEELRFEETLSFDKRDDDVVIVSAVRTPFTKAKRGGLATVHWTELLAHALKASVERINLNPELVNDIQVGTVLAAGGGAHQARMAEFLAGFPETTSLSSTNRQCSSGLQSIATIAAAIKSGYIEIGIGAGVESMSSSDMSSAIGPLSEKLFGNEKSRDCLIPMGQTSENVAERFGITREEQDEFALLSYEKALTAQSAGLFDAEIAPIVVSVTSDDQSVKKVTISKDDGIRPTTLEGLKKLRPAFKPNGTTTAGNSSQVSDGAAAVVLMSRRMSKKLGLTPLGKFVSFAVSGVPPDVMGIGPAFAIPQALEKAKLHLSDIDIFEINEAFASQAYYTIKKLGIDPKKVNPLGGAIALGHPLGATGARQVTTLLAQLRRTGGKLGVVSMCIGTGMGAAAVLQLE